MNQAELEQISRDASPVFTGLRLGKVFPLSRASFAIDFYPHSGEYLYINLDPKVRSCYLITRRLKDLERSSIHASPFVINLRKLLAGSEVTAIAAVPEADKVMMIDLASPESAEITLAVQLGGKRPDILILRDGMIVDALHENRSRNERYIPPSGDGSHEPPRDSGDKTLSEVLEAAENAVTGKTDLEKLANAVRRKLKADIAKRRRLISNLEGDLAEQGNADDWKRYGDLILANLANIRREDDAVIVTDYFDAEQREIAIPVNRDVSPKDAAESFFRRYTKARNGAAEISKRLEAVNSEVERLEAKLGEVEVAVEREDTELLSRSLPEQRPAEPQKRKRDKTDEFKGARRFVSSDGFEILVGKQAKDNDHLTFRVARSLDLWLHAADYPGSHVVVRNPGRQEFPVQTLTEAAQLAAFYSNAREQPKAAVNYTQRKFVNKPKRSAPGLVSLASFKTILVEPKVSIKAKESV